jgi:hypothetical protein
MCTAAQHALYMPDHGVGLIPLMLPILTMVPFAAMSNGANAWVMAIRPKKFVSKTFLAGAKSTSRIGIA